MSSIDPVIWQAAISGNWPIAVGSSQLVALPSYLPESIAYFSAMTVQEPPAVKLLIDNFIRTWMAEGIWAKTDRLLIGLGTQQASLLDMKQPTKTASNVGCTFTPYQGFRGNGTSAFIDFGETYNFAGNNFSLDSAFQIAYTNVAPSGAVARPIGNPGGGDRSRIAITTAFVYNANDTGGTVAGTIARVGCYLWTRTASNLVQVYYNGTQFGANQTNASVAVGAGNACGLRQQAMYSDEGVPSLGYGGGLTPSQSVTAQTSLQTLMLGLGSNF